MTDHLFVKLATQLAALEMRCARYDVQISSLENRVVQLESQLEEVRMSDSSPRNRSSSTYRDMVTEDAYRVLNGDLANLRHKDAATVLGLTYAQVYSARYCYTFKNVHRALTNSGWVSPWVKS